MLSENARRKIKEKLEDVIEDAVLDCIDDLDPCEYIDMSYIQDRVADKLGPYIQDEVSDLIDEAIDDIL